MKEDSKLTILYTLKGIQPYDPAKGYVALLLSPLDKITQTQQRRYPGNVGVVGMGKSGPIPPEDMRQIQEMIEGFTGRKKNHDEDRDIILIEPEAEYQKRKWNYGDLIEATFVKVDDKQDKAAEEQTE
jgi:hypothetical protein